MDSFQGCDVCRIWSMPHPLGCQRHDPIVLVSDTPPADPNRSGRQGCPLCGHITQTRSAMLEHYSDVHHVNLEAREESVYDSWLRSAEPNPDPTVPEMLAGIRW